ncbi:MAG: nucleotidyltransferase family protein [Kosmotogaceae bacterium]|nr:nucleotidyltransferase family protein [Kosmotogaceae bacterium]
MESNSVSLILLAAGESSRFGDEKLCSDFRGKPLLQWALDNLKNLGVLNKFLITKPGFELNRFDTGNFKVLINYDYGKGISTSIVRGLCECAEECTGIVLVLADMPMVSGEDVEFLLDSLLPEDEMVSFVYEGRKGFPTFIAKKLFPELLKITGDRGAFQLVKNGRSKIRGIEGSKQNILDIDSPEDKQTIR